jgi:cell division protein FtsL
MENVNFLESNRLRSQKKERVDKKTFLIFFLIVILVLVVFAVVLGISIYFDAQNNSVTNDINSVRAQIVANEDNERDYLVFYHKVTTLTEIIERRREATDLMVWATEYFADGRVLVRSVEYDIFAAEFQLLLQAYSIFYFQEMLDLLANPVLHRRPMLRACPELQECLESRGCLEENERFLDVTNLESCECLGLNECVEFVDRFDRIENLDMIRDSAGAYNLRVSFSLR